jgi:hypothetical protein
MTDMGNWQEWYVMYVLQKFNAYTITLLYHIMKEFITAVENLHIFMQFVVIMEDYYAACQ